MRDHPSTASTVLKWGDVVTDSDQNLVSVPNIGGVFRDMSNGKDRATIVPWSGTDPFAHSNCWSWCQKDEIYKIQMVNYNDTWTHLQGPVHAGQFRPTSVKGQQLTRTTCVSFSGTLLTNPEDEGSTTSLKTYKDQCWQHMITNGMADVFTIPDPRNNNKSWNLFDKLGQIPSPVCCPTC